MAEIRKREIAYKVRIGDILRAERIFEEQELTKVFRFVELGDKQIRRINLIANVIDKFEGEGENKFISLTLDDGSGQIRARFFNEDIQKVRDIIPGDTVLIIGLLRFFNNEIYILPEIIRKQDPRYLLIRKLELEKNLLSEAEMLKEKGETKAIRDEIIELIKNMEPNGIDKEEIILQLKNINPVIANQEIQKLLEDGVIYEPKPGIVRYLG